MVARVDLKSTVQKTCGFESHLAHHIFMNKSSRTLTASTTRQKKTASYRSFRLSSKITPDSLKKLPSSKQLWTDTLVFLWVHKKKMLQFVAIYLVAYLLLVKGYNDFTYDTETLKEELADVGDGNIGAIFTFLTLYWSLLSSTTIAYDDLTNFFQVSVLVIFSLAFIWLVRKLHKRNSDATVKQAFYQGMRPLIPFLIILGVLVLELLPAAIGSLLYVTAQSTNVTATETELLGITVVMILGLVMSIYLLSGTMFALYIVTLPKMTPITAIKASLRLLRIHRWIVLRKIVGFFVALIVLGFFLVLPFIIWIPQHAEIAFFVLGSCSFALTHTFLFKLYRSLL